MSDIVRRSIAVYDGQLVDPFTVTHLDGVFRIETIAHALSMLCRYGGHTSRFYSVAEHCLLVENEVAKRAAWIAQTTHERRTLQRIALIHDATEAFIGDIVAPFKPDMPSIIAAEHRLDVELRRWLDVDGYDDRLIKTVDVEIRGTEARQLFRLIHQEWGAKLAPVIPGIQCGTMSPIEAKTAWLAKFWELFPNFKE